VQYCALALHLKQTALHHHTPQRKTDCIHHCYQQQHCHDDAGGLLLLKVKSRHSAQAENGLIVWYQENINLIDYDSE
jgi:hypothetical protein